MTHSHQSAKRFMHYLFRFPKELLLAFLIGCISGISTVVMTYYIGKAVDTMVKAKQVQFSELFFLLAMIGGILLVTTISQWIIQLIGNKVSYQSVNQLRKELFTHLNNLPLSYFDQRSHGDIISRFTNDLDLVADACVALFNNLFTGMTTVLAALVVMLWLSPTLTLIVLIMTPLIFILTWLVAKFSQDYFVQQQNSVGKIAGFMSEIVGNQKIVKAFDYEIPSFNEFNKLNQELYIVGQKAQFVSSLTNPVSRFIDHLAYIGLGLVGGILILSNHGQLSVGILSSFTIYSAQFSKPFIEFSGLTPQIQTALAGLKRTFALLDTPVETPELSTVQNLTHITGVIDFDHVYFSYYKNQPLIQDFTLHVSAGETVAIVGKTGAGKSTLVNLLMRFYELDKGTIKIDQKSIRNYHRDSLRKSFGMVLQDTWLFDGTIRENLTYGNPLANEETIIKATKAAKIHSFIQRLPKGYDTVIGASGVEISEGQRQLLTIARTMIVDPPMLILDEATSSVDARTESQIQNAFLAMMENKTSFVIAHRLATIQQANIIIVMDQGKIVEIGNHHDLLKNTEGAYYQLYQAQFQESVNNSSN